VPGLARAATAEPVTSPPRRLTEKITSRIAWRTLTTPIIVLPVYDYLGENDLGVSDDVYD
jgi:hypothetical protein